MKRDEVLTVLDDQHNELLSAGSFSGEGCWFHNGQEEEVVADYAKARAFITSALDDAERYRWLRDNCYINRLDTRETPHAVIAVCVGASQNGIGWMHPGHTPGVGVPSLDTAVDTARATEAGWEGLT